MPGCISRWKKRTLVPPEMQASSVDVSPHSVWTAGRIELTPGAPSIIPGRAEMLFQFRDAEPATLDRLHAHLVAENRELLNDSSSLVSARASSWLRRHGEVVRERGGER